MIGYGAAVSLNLLALLVARAGQGIDGLKGLEGLRRPGRKAVLGLMSSAESSRRMPAALMVILDVSLGPETERSMPRPVENHRGRRLHSGVTSI